MTDTQLLRLIEIRAHLSTASHRLTWTPDELFTGEVLSELSDIISDAEDSLESIIGNQLIKRNGG